MRARRQHQPPRAEHHRLLAQECRDLARPEGAPDQRVRFDGDGGGARPAGERDALAELGVGRVVAVAGGERLQELSARGVAFVEHDHGGARLGGGDGGGEAGWPGADDEHVAVALGSRAGGRRERARGRRRVGGNRHAVAHLGEAGPLAGSAVDGDDTVEAGAHAAMDAARRARGRAAQGDDAGGGERGGHGFAGAGRDVAAIEADRDGRGLGMNGPVSEAHRGPPADVRRARRRRQEFLPGREAATAVGLAAP